MIVLNIIQENNQDDICEFCEINILGKSRNSSYYQCEGRYCDDANELFYDKFPEKQNNFPDFYYKESIDTINQIENLNNRLLDFEKKLENQLKKSYEFNN